TEEDPERLKNILHRETLFGAGSEFKNPMDDEVLARKEFYEIPIVKSLHGKAGKQIGSSGSGNHFVEFGIIEIPETHKTSATYKTSEVLKKTSEVLPPAGKYLALL